MKKLLSIALFSFMSTLCNAGDLNEQPCINETKGMMIIATPWDEILKSMKDLPSECFDGYFAEGISDTFVKKLAKEWKSFFAGYSKFENEPSIKNIVSRSFNASLDQEDLKKISLLSKDSCPEGNKQLCKELESYAVGAMKEIHDK